MDDNCKPVAKKAEVRIGGASAFITDSPGAARQLLDGGNLDYLVFDFLAEVTIAILAKAKAKRPQAGYAEEFVSIVLEDVLADALDRGVRIVANAGGVNLPACRAAVEELAQRLGVDPVVAIVEGDDVSTPLNAGRIGDVEASAIREMESDAALPDALVSANAYLGAPAIAAALDAGADVVITGRVVDSAVTLGPLIHEFGWSFDDYDLLSQGSLAGHIIECGAQATGGLFTDWQDVPDWAQIGYPILECSPDGAFVVTKPPGSGGLVSEATVAEQLLYEIGDPCAYLLPDVTCDWSEVQIEQVGDDRVRVIGARGRAPSSQYKVCATYDDGFRCMTMMPIVGRDAAAKGQRQAQAVLERCERLFAERDLEPFRSVRTESLGAEHSYGAHARTAASREVLTKVAVEHTSKTALRLFAREILSPTTSMSVGSTGWFLGGRPPVTSVLRLFSFLLDKASVPVTVDVGRGPVAVEVPTSPRGAEAARPQESTSDLPKPTEDHPSETSTQGENETTDDASLIGVPLIEVAWGRSGDKGNTFNVGVIARRPQLLPWIRRSLTCERVAAHMQHHFDDPKAAASGGAVRRYDLPGINAINFLFTHALGGGGMGSMRLDPLAKGMAQQFLEIEVEVPADLVEAGANGPIAR